MTSIRVPERGWVDVTADEWRTLKHSDEFWRLVERGIISPTALNDGRARLRGSMYVGSAMCGHLRVDCVEKVAGALQALLPFAMGGLRPELIPGPSSESSELIGLVVEAFLGSVEAYVSSGLDWRYSSSKHVGSLVSGRLLVPETLALRAHGVPHQLAFARPVIDRAVPINKVVAVALREVEVIGALALSSPAQVNRARAVALLFEECSDLEVLALPRAEWVARATALLDARSENQAMRDLLSLALALLAHSGLEHTARTIGEVPTSWFVNLEDLFEKAVRGNIAHALDDGETVSKGAGDGVYVFPDSALLDADPDLIIRWGDQRVSIGDVKYKSWKQRASASDLYQLLTHANTYGSSLAFLVFPADGDSLEFIGLGTSSTGQQVQLFAVPVLSIPDGVAELLEVLQASQDQSRADQANLPSGRVSGSITAID